MMALESLTRAFLLVWYRINSFTTQSRLLTTLSEKPIEKIKGKGENAGYHHFFLFPTLFSTLSRTKIIFLSTFMCSSAYVFSLDQSKILSFGKDLKSKDLNHILLVTSIGLVYDFTW